MPYTWQIPLSFIIQWYQQESAANDDRKLGNAEYSSENIRQNSFFLDD